MQDSNKKILETLEVNNEILDNIHETFMQIVFKGKFKVHSFYEARGVTGMRGLEGKVGMIKNLLGKADNSRWWITSLLSLTFPENLRLSRASMRTICKWPGAPVEMTKYTALSLVF